MTQFVRPGHRWLLKIKAQSQPRNNSTDSVTAVFCPPSASICQHLADLRLRLLGCDVSEIFKILISLRSNPAWTEYSSKNHQFKDEYNAKCQSSFPFSLACSTVMSSLSDAFLSTLRSGLSDGAQVLTDPSSADFKEVNICATVYFRFPYSPHNPFRNCFGGAILTSRSLALLLSLLLRKMLLMP